MNRFNLSRVIRDFVATRITRHPRALPLGAGKGAADCFQPDAAPTNSPREQWIVDEIRKADGQ